MARRIPKNKEEAREQAIRWQQLASTRSMSWGEITRDQAYFTKIAKKFKLTREFKENGII